MTELTPTVFSMELGTQNTWLIKPLLPINNFQHFSVFVWAVWLIPYFTGFFASMR